MAATLLDEAVRANPNISGKAMLSQVKARLNSVSVGDFVSTRTLYRARRFVNTSDDNTYYTSYWARLEEYLGELRAKNSDCRVVLEKDQDNRFQRYFVGIKSSIDVLEHCGLGCFAVDVCCTTHHIANGLQLHIIAARTGMNTNIIIGWSLELSESNDSYAWLSMQADALGLGRLLSAPSTVIRATPVVFSNGFKGAARFAEKFPTLHHARCARHLSSSIRATLKKMQNSNPRSNVQTRFSDAQVLAVCSAKTDADYQQRLARLKDTSLHAAEDLVGKSTLTYSTSAMASAGIPCYGRCTSNAVEGTSGVLEAMCQKHPYVMTDELVLYVSQRLCYHKHETQKLLDANKILTPFASAGFKDALATARRCAFDVQPQDNGTFLVFDSTSGHQV